MLIQMPQGLGEIANRGTKDLKYETFWKSLEDLLQGWRFFIHISAKHISFCEDSDAWRKTSDF